MPGLPEIVGSVYSTSTGQKWKVALKNKEERRISYNSASPTLKRSGVAQTVVQNSPRSEFIGGGKKAARRAPGKKKCLCIGLVSFEGQRDTQYLKGMVLCACVAVTML